MLRVALVSEVLVAGWPSQGVSWGTLFSLLAFALVAITYALFLFQQSGIPFGELKEIVRESITDQISNTLYELRHLLRGYLAGQQGGQTGKASIEAKAVPEPETGKIGGDTRIPVG